MKTLETSRLCLRDFRLNDCDDFFEYAKSDKVGPMAGWKPHENKEESQKILEMFMSENEVWAIELKSISKVIGSIGLHKDSRRNNPKSMMLGYVLSEDYWGKGMMVEAARAVLDYGFNECDLSLISVYHFPFNTQSSSVIHKLGFKPEGVIRQSTLRYDNVMLDSVCYSMTKDEFNAL